MFSDRSFFRLSISRNFSLHIVMRVYFSLTNLLRSSSYFYAREEYACCESSLSLKIFRCVSNRFLRTFDNSFANSLFSSSVFLIRVSNSLNWLRSILSNETYVCIYTSLRCTNISTISCIVYGSVCRQTSLNSIYGSI
jgi:hypothetical protein